MFQKFREKEAFGKNSDVHVTQNIVIQSKHQAKVKTKQTGFFSFVKAYVLNQMPRTWSSSSVMSHGQVTHCKSINMNKASPDGYLTLRGRTLGIKG